ncbi:MAG: carboxylating nicotinate-nucleotide diphosphorylase [Zoogloeaceae bacterium]|jgi:nicotinate-nucleotide pyrophosphorylase (carboxylating)|nr:carboxylating nicotinate-nucleotide diphosphorylase [Zoogloeaceae bacterium]
MTSTDLARHLLAFPELPALAEEIAAQAAAALAEDIGPGDLSAQLIPAQQTGQAWIITREAGILCGRAWAEACFTRLDPGVRLVWRAEEGARVAPGECLCELSGNARALLSGERAALNFLQLLSGIASRTRQYVDLAAGTPAQIVDTRKTLPGLRLAQKYAVRAGGGGNHRLALWDAILVKENHIIAAGGIPPALAAAREISRASQGRCRFIQIEVENLEEMQEALEAGAEMLLLDNFDLPALREAVARNRLFPRPAILEASGEVTLETLPAIAKTGVDRISIGALSKNVQALNLSMRFRSSEG